jgi:L-threonylcarbamoyladenylate synthase
VAAAPVVAADQAGLATAARALADGAPVALPTDTVYGLAVDPVRAGAADRLFAAKGRGRDVPLAVLVADVEQAWALTPAPVGWSAARLAARHWPGALTLVVPRIDGWDADIGDAGATVGLRCPNHRWMQALLRVAGPLATTSANRHGQATPSSAAEIAAMFGDDIALVVDGGSISGKSSTVVRCLPGAPPEVLRAGAVPRDELGLSR